MESIESVLKLEKLVFDKIEFNRKGFQNDNEIEFSFEIQIGHGKDDIRKVTIVLRGEKEQEYDLLISLTGFFSISNDGSLQDSQVEEILNSNTVAILMPYLRSELSILTAQPEMDCVVLPPFNINRMLTQSDE